MPHARLSPRIRRRLRAAAYLANSLVAGVAGGCYSGLDDAAAIAEDGIATAPDGGHDDADDADAGEDPALGDAGPYPFQRLTRREYDNTVQDLLGTSLQLARDFPGELAGAGGFVQSGPVSTLDAQLYMEASETLAAEAVTDLDTLLPCDPAGAAEAACVEQFITDFTRRAFRRPAAPDEIAELVALFDAARGPELGMTVSESIAMVLQGVLQSPSFLYKWELGPGPIERDGELVALGTHQVAARLSYLLWGTMPDDELRRAADEGELETNDGVLAQAERMLQDDRAVDTYVDFHRQWLELRAGAQLEKNPNVYPQFDEQLRASFDAETAAFLHAVLVVGDGSLRTLLTADWTYANASLAALYGVQATGDDLQLVELDPQRRAGLLTQAAFLATGADDVGSNPVRRGKTVLTRLLCNPVPPPPANVPLPEAPEPGTTTRERFEQHAENPCASCHVSMDPLGFAFENYDAVGAFRELDAGQPVDATGTVRLPSGEEVTFGNAIDLVHALADSEDVSQCVTSQWFRYAHGRLEDVEDLELLALMHDELLANELDVRRLLLTMVAAESFRWRRFVPGEAE